MLSYEENTSTENAMGYISEYSSNATIGDYILTICCGSGGFGEVWLAKNRVSGMSVALKIITNRGQGAKEKSGLIKFQQCRHPNLIKILHVGETDNKQLYYTMDCADNAGTEHSYIADSLENRIKKGKISPEECYILAGKIAEALGYLHRAGMVHRDVKPGNILFIKGEPVLADIGLVTQADVDTSFAGTKGFMPDYVWNEEHEPCPASDFYALGVTLQCALSGTTNIQTAKRNCSITLSGHGGDLQRLCCTLEDQSKNYSNSDGFIDSSEKFLKCLHGKNKQINQAASGKICIPNSGQSCSYNGLKYFAIGLLVFAALYFVSAVKMQLQEGFGDLNVVQICYMYFVSVCMFLCPPLELLYCRKILKSHPEVSSLRKSEVLKYAILLGIFGGHRFYAGRKITGTLMLLSFGGVGIWWVTDILLIFCNYFIDGDKKLIENK